MISLEQFEDEIKHYARFCIYFLMPVMAIISILILFVFVNGINKKIHKITNKNIVNEQVIFDLSQENSEQNDRLDKLESQAHQRQLNSSKAFQDTVYGNLALIEQQQIIIHSSILRLRDKLDASKKSNAP